MKNWIQSCIYLVTIFLFSCNSEKQDALEINGKLIGMESDTILLIKPNQDTRFDSIIKIPVKNGTFYYREKLENPEKVNLALAKSVKSGAYRPIPLFLENEEINLTIFPEAEFDKNIVEGGRLNAQYKTYKQNFRDKFLHRTQPFQDSLKDLFKDEAYYSDKMKVLYSKLRNANNQDEKVVIYEGIDSLTKAGQNLSPEAKRLEDQLKLIYEEQKSFQQAYIEKNPTIVSYSFLLDELIYNKETLDIPLVKKNLKILSAANPGHPYNDLASRLISAIENVKVGQSYIDFSAPDLDGNQVKLSEKISGKVALLDLWATWCGPCIAKSRTMIPLYNEYKDKGFVIVGVAGEFKNTDRLVKFLEREKWPWLNLVELDRENAIWQKYGVDGGGGGLFLIDEEGIILAKDPSAEEVRLELETRLN